jgi:hypothetical protein
MSGVERTTVELQNGNTGYMNAEKYVLKIICDTARRRREGWAI